MIYQNSEPEIIAENTLRAGMKYFPVVHFYGGSNESVELLSAEVQLKTE